MTSSLTEATFVQDAYAVPQSLTVSVSVTLPSPQGAGNLVVVLVGWSDVSSTIFSVADSRGDVYALAIGSTGGSDTSGQSQSIYYARSVSAGSNTVTVSWNQLVPFPDVRVLEYSGIDPTSPLDGACSSSGSGLDSTSGSLTTTNANDLLVAGNSVATWTTSAGSGWTSRGITSPDGDVAQDRSVSATGTYVATAPLGTPGAWVMQMAAFRICAPCRSEGGDGGSADAVEAGGDSDEAGGSGGVAWPLTVSSNGRYLVDQNDTPFFIAGDSDWTLVDELPEASRAAFFGARKAQGFNTILFELQSHSFYGPDGISGPATANVPADPTGQLPFLMGTDGQPYTAAGARAGQHADFATPNDAFFARAADIVDQAATYGMAVDLYVMPWGFADAAAGWWNDIVDPANTQAVCLAFGRYLATGHGPFTGFASRANVIWTHGSDLGQQSSVPPSAEGEQRMLQLLNGLVAGGATQLRAGDWEAPSLSTDDAVFASSMTVNAVYTYGGLWNGSPGDIPSDGTTYQQALQGWFYTPSAPVFLKETFYEHSVLFGGSKGTPPNLRNCHYWAILAGATNGVIYGNENTWPFFDGTWQSAMNDPGVADLTRLASLFQAVSWWTLAPTGRPGLTTLVTAGGGTYGLGDYVAAALDPAGHLAVAFMPTARTVTLDLTKMAGPVTARWYDPTTGIYTTASGSPFANTGTEALAPPAGPHADGAADWVLVLTS